MRCGKIRCDPLDIIGGFPDDFDIANNRILDHFAFQKPLSLKALRITVDPVNRRDDMPQIIRNP